MHCISPTLGSSTSVTKSETPSASEGRVPAEAFNRAMSNASGVMPSSSAMPKVKQNSFFLIHAGCCASRSSCAHAACGGCSLTTPCGQESMSREKRSLSAVRLEKRRGFDLLSSSAHTFFSTARCETAN